MGWDWGTIVAILTVLGIVGEAWRRWVLPFLRRIGKFLDAWNGEPARDGLPARPGMVGRVIAIEAQVSNIEYQVHNNGGASMKDGVDRIEKASEVAAEAARVAADRATAAAEMVTATKAALDDHIEQSNILIEQGKQAEQEIRGTIATLADAVNVAARSTPPDDTHGSHA